MRDFDWLLYLRWKFRAESIRDNTQISVELIHHYDFLAKMSDSLTTNTAAAFKGLTSI